MWDYFRGPTRIMHKLNMVRKKHQITVTHFSSLFPQRICYICPPFSFSLPSQKLRSGVTSKQALLPPRHCSTCVQVFREKGRAVYSFVDSRRFWHTDAKRCLQTIWYKIKHPTAGLATLTSAFLLVAFTSFVWRIPRDRRATGVDERHVHSAARHIHAVPGAIG